ncbi:MAG: phosphoadenylyl-sulfate reductase [Burkholderiaceae bacterium]
MDDAALCETPPLPSRGAPADATAIALYANAGADFPAKLDQATRLLEAAAQEHAGRIVQTTSLGAEDMVITDLIVRLGLDIAIGTLDTGRLHAETLALIPRIERRYGRHVEICRPQAQQVVRFVQGQGADAMRRSVELRKACCRLRKMEPLGRLLEGRRAWITGLRREHSSDRADVAPIEIGSDGRAKLSPLADWTWGEVWHYIALHEVPYNPLHDEFMPSIGCAPCTRAIAVGEDFRAGRWWWEDETAKECGLHSTKKSDAVAS